MCEISVIVPAFNNENTLPQCLDSILNQTCQPAEIILLNDGSTDRTSVICREYANKYPHIRYHELHHGGVSNARRVGLAKATGDYICFVDSDDRILPEMLEKLLQLVISGDCLMGVCGYYTIKNTERSTVVPMEAHSVHSPDALKLLFTDEGFGGFLWNKIYHRSLLTDDVFEEGLTHCEDLYLNAALLSRSDFTVAVLHEPLYEYYSTSAGATSAKNYFTSGGDFCYAPAFRKISQQLSSVQKTDVMPVVYAKYADILEYSMYTLLTSGPTAGSDITRMKHFMRQALPNTMHSRRKKGQKIHYLILTFAPKLYAKLRL